MGELFVMNQPRRRSPLPATLGILGSSKGNTFAVGSEGTAGPAPAVGPVSPGQVAAVLQTLNTIANPEPPQRITATGESLPGAVDKARRLRPPPVPPPPPVYVSLPYLWPGGAAPAPAPTSTPMVGPGPAFPGGGGGGGGAVAGDDQAAADPPVFLGMTQTQLVIAGGVGLVAFLLLRKKKSGAAPAEGAGL